MRWDLPTSSPLSAAAGSDKPLAVGAGDGATLAFDLGVTGTAFLAVVIAGVPQPPDVYDISLGTGTGGCDQIVFRAGCAPALGAAIEATVFTT